MRDLWKSAGWIIPILFSAVAFTPAVVSADPVRITVNFSVTGDNDNNPPNIHVDPVFGTAVGTGSFSIVASPPIGGGIVENWDTGLGAEFIAFTFGGTSWTTDNADIGRLIFNAAGAVTLWQLSGVPAGLDMMSFTVFPDILVSPFDFDYTTADSPQLGIFEGTTVSSTISVTPAAATPEPASLVLIATGFFAIVHREIRRRRPPAGPRGSRFGEAH